MEKENLNQSINSNRRKLLGLAGVTGAGALLSPLLAKAFPTTIIEAGSGVDTASYIIFQDSGIIYAKNGTTGAIQFSNADASTVINSAISALTNGGKIFIKAGNYNIMSTINIAKSSIIIEGESYGSIEGSGEIGTAFAFWHDFELMRLAKIDNTLLEGIILKNFKVIFTGSSRTGSIIYTKDVSYSLFENIVVSGGGSTGNGFTLDAIDQFCVTNKFIGYHSKGIQGAHLNMQARAGKFVTVNHFIGCRFFNGTIGVDLQNEAGKTGDVDYNSFIDCIFDTTVAYGVKDNGVGNSYIACTFMDITTGYTYGGQIGSRDAAIIGCTGLGNALKIENLGSAIIKNNPGYKTESNVLSGTFAIDSTGIKTITIPHGLAITPAKQDCYLTVIQNTPTDDWEYTTLKAVSADATNVIAKINISKANATAGATAKLGLRAGNA